MLLSRRNSKLILILYFASKLLFYYNKSLTYLFGVTPRTINYSVKQKEKENLKNNLCKISIKVLQLFKMQIGNKNYILLACKTLIIIFL